MSDVKSAPARKETGYLYEPRSNSRTRRRDDDTIDPKDCLGISIFAFGTTFFMSAMCLIVVYNRNVGAAAKVVRSNLFIRLVGVEGLDPRASQPAPPAFHLAIDAEGGSQYYRACNGGESSMLRVSYHGMILAWGQVPHFCVDGGQSRDRVATLQAKAEAAMLRKEVRSLIWSEQQVVGKAEFDVEGDVVGLG
ncbi:hypothetical protein ACP70R_037093 [Stipagrostis hirtigluma subsp. patula]